MAVARAGTTVASLVIGKIVGTAAIIVSIAFLIVGTMFYFLNYIYNTITAVFAGAINTATCSIPVLGCQGNNIVNSVTKSIQIPSEATLELDALLFLAIGISFLIIAIFLFIGFAVLLFTFVFVGLVASVILIFSLLIHLPPIFWDFFTKYLVI